ncbi:FmdE family protein [Methanonatronarchaeum sp. AMET-Sl]|uniref:FmdE family protein n=1 Tax=Methanonatronarchaeum sp. AMET-Sl TaxID=3037654 RepID=UPI00244D9CCA|nr:FmdE family protein [Methanonatronarchaeum sp. AMET-Sl]WGI17377.1 FmdE family protein [Methanonatronarchaeum sp. AMET-Sl]
MKQKEIGKIEYQNTTNHKITLKEDFELNPEIGNEILLSYQETEKKTNELTKAMIIDIKDNEITIKLDEKIPKAEILDLKIPENSASIHHPRQKINKSIEEKNLHKLVLEAAKIHGHICPMIVLGIKVGADGIKKLNLRHEGMEDTLVLTETNSCFSDGIQTSTGCTFGNNALIYRDYGKTAVTIIKRNEKAIRYHYNQYNYIEKNYPDTYNLFEKVVKNREGTPEEQKQLQKKWTEIALDLLDTPLKEMFKIKTTNSTKHLNLPKKAPIFKDRYCSDCGEKIMAPKAIKENKEHKCIPCSNKNYLQLDGSGLKEINQKNNNTTKNKPP